MKTDIVGRLQKHVRMNGCTHKRRLLIDEIICILTSARVELIEAKRKLSEIKAVLASTKG